MAYLSPHIASGSSLAHSKEAVNIDATEITEEANQ